MVELARLLAIDEIETGKGVNQIRSLRHPGETRWVHTWALFQPLWTCSML
jgi:hypothetical protein